MIEIKKASQKIKIFYRRVIQITFGGNLITQVIGFFIELVAFKIKPDEGALDILPCV